MGWLRAGGGVRGESCHPLGGVSQGPVRVSAPHGQTPPTCGGGGTLDASIYVSPGPWGGAHGGLGLPQPPRSLNTRRGGGQPDVRYPPPPAAHTHVS